MSKKLLAAAIAAALAPAAVMAEASNVTIYGRIDYGFMSRGGDDRGNAQAAQDGRQNSFEDGIAGGNRIGFRGNEDLGNGLKAIFEIEFGFNGDTNGVAGTFNRHSWVGLEGAFGTVLGGRVDGARYSFVGQYDPFKNQTVANAGSLFGVTSGLGMADRGDNAIVYITPELAPGLKFLGAYTTSLLGEEGANNAGAPSPILGGGDGSENKAGNTPLYAIAALYNNGPLSVTLYYENLQVKKAAVAAGGDLEFDVYGAGASYDFGVAKLSAYYEKTQGDNALSKTFSDGDGWLIGLSAPVTSNITLKASYVQANDDRADNRDCSKWGLGGEYAFSKRTTAYATYAKINNDSAAVCSISKNATGNSGLPTGTAGAPTSAGYGDSGFNIGLAHTF